MTYGTGGAEAATMTAHAATTVATAHTQTSNLPTHRRVPA